MTMAEQKEIGMLVPEYVIARMLRTIIDMLRSDLKNNEATPEKTILYRMYHVGEEGLPLVWNFNNFFKNMKAMILNEDNLSINWGFNPKAANNLALHILLPSESTQMSIGADEGYLEEDITEEVDVDNGDGTTHKETRVVGKQQFYTQTFDSTYQIMITGANGVEVTYTYNILKSMFLMLIDQMELMGLRTPSFSGNDIVMQDDLAPVPIFHKVLNISLKYEHNVPQLLYKDIAKNFYFHSHATLDIDSCDDEGYEPTEGLKITENGTYNVREYYWVEVDVKGIEIYMSNGDFCVDGLTIDKDNNIILEER